MGAPDQLRLGVRRQLVVQAAQRVAPRAVDRAALHDPHRQAVLGELVLAERTRQEATFVGVWLGGAVYDATGAYDLMWWLSIALGMAAAIVHLPISERPATRLATA